MPTSVRMAASERCGAVFALAGLMVLAIPSAHAEVEASLDLRLLDSDGRNTFIDGGFGKLRYDAADDGVQLGRARLAWRGSPGGNWHANIDVSAWSLDDHHAIDVTEAWLEWRPVPQSAWRSNLKIGAFYPPISLEHRAPGWSNPYTISSSALNSWVGEELRTIGIGYELEHLGIADGGTLDAGVHAAVFGWNDPAGVIVGLRGFAMHDRQTPLFGRIGSYAFGGREQRVLFSEIDHRAGFHTGAYVKRGGLELRALHYDNRGDSSIYKASIEDFAWDTRFNSLGLRYDGPQGTTIIAQWLGGSTAAGTNAANYWDFKAAFVLVAHDLGRHRIAIRYDDFHTDQKASAFPGPLGRESGKAFTLGWTWAVRAHVELAAEWLRIDSRYNNRAALGEAPVAVEHLAQLALRLSL
jgi:hypothetical protein